MNEEKKKKIACFRFNVISDLVLNVHLEKGELTKLIKERSERTWDIPYSKRETLSETTIRRWIKAYEEGDHKIESLYPKSREDRGSSRAINSETGLALLQLKEKYDKIKVPQIMDEMKKRHLTPIGEEPGRATVYRFFHQNGGLKSSRPKVNRRRFEAEYPNDIWQTDVMHGPRIIIDGKRKKTYLIAFIDDHSRLVPSAGFYPNERIDSFLYALRIALSSRGLPRKIYTDNGSVFRTKHLAFITASLQISLIHAKPYTPQSKGKVERFFRTVRDRFLSMGHPNTLLDLNETFSAWLNDDYHQTIHSATNQSPIERFAKNSHVFRSAPENLEDYFRTVAIRTVTADRVVYLNGNTYEAPVDLIKEKIEVLYHPHRIDCVEARFEGKSYGYLNLLDVAGNVNTRREEPASISTSVDEAAYPENGMLFSENTEDEEIKNEDIDAILF